MSRTCVSVRRLSCPEPARPQTRDHSRSLEIELVATRARGRATHVCSVEGARERYLADARAPESASPPSLGETRGAEYGGARGALGRPPSPRADVPKRRRTAREPSRRRRTRVACHRPLAAPHPCAHPLYPAQRGAGGRHPRHRRRRRASHPLCPPRNRGGGTPAPTRPPHTARPVRRGDGLSRVRKRAALSTAFRGARAATWAREGRRGCRPRSSGSRYA